ncbi:SusC/RagA family TonB-linked outer membrane protein [Mucilaginibacter sp. BJC16-A38]|uniref:SusC/RagA family TonB-linked outer membrane protein n=1 Tax=Mucilaginibacter phenanthrenivorans TaxID=1234842 RepID=UPI00215863EB|nr:SusC/RagA family TonB-linked outer membrane protein [Mucilaginibacter phenanthrenivorans]MCR8556514.1 SusC/RagA family TonB-linked outer membrane protein [Mucilaginibacter phenanthrenivorans]
MKKLQLFKIWKIMMITLSVNLFSITLYAQTIALRGKIVNQKGEPLIGATVRIPGTSAAATANVEGNFTLAVPNDTREIVISFVGYTELTKAIPPGIKNLGTITLNPSSKNLNEVVVVGYGTLKRENVTGTVATVDAKTLKEIPSSNVFQQLQGRVAGLDVVTSTNGPVITIRGDRTVGASPGTDGPLIILDGAPFYNSIENINPNDIKSVDVLKGASATAIYGSRASGGVILITTNRGRVGQTITSYDSYYGISTPEGSMKLLNGNQFAQLETDATQGALLQSNVVGNNYALSATETKALNAGISTNYPDLLLKNGYIWDQSLRVSGGTERTQFTVGAGYRVNTGLEPNNSTKRVSLNATLDHKINKYIKFGLSSLTTLRMINAGGGNQLQAADYMSPLTYPYNADGSINLLPQSDQFDATTGNPLYPGSRPDLYYNYTRGFESNSILYGELSPVEHLKYRYSVNYSYNQSLAGTYNGVNGIGILTIPQTTASTVNNYSYRLTQEHLLTYDNVFAEKHAVNFVAVFSNELAHTENSGFNATGIPSNANLNSNLALAQTVIPQNGAYSEQGLVSYVGRLNYAYDRKYNLTLAIRSDANSALAAGHQRTTYPSVGLGWVISNEDFMKRFTFIDNLKLRGGYGQTSTITTISPYNTLGQLSSSKYQFGGASTGDQQGVRVTTLVNSNLTWQRSAEYNLALDFAVLKNRITGSVEVYQTRTTGIILPNQLPVTNGASSQVSNLGTSQNKGLELTLSSVNIRSERGINWSTDFNIGFDREKILSLPNGALQNISSGEFVGQPLNVIYDVRKTGIWQNSEASQAAVYGQKPGSIKIQDLNGDGKIDAKDDQIIGHFNPNYTFGLTNRVSYKNFDISIVVQARMGFTTAVPYVSSSNSSTNGWQFLNLGRHNQPVINYWTPTNPSNAFPEPNAYTQLPYYSTLQYYDGSFIRAKSINLGYNFSDKLANKLGMSSLRIYTSVSNPFFIYAPIRRHGFSVPDAESGFAYNAGAVPADPSVSGNIGGANAGNGGQFFRGVSVNNAAENTRDFILGINARF